MNSLRLAQIRTFEVSHKNWLIEYFLDRFTALRISKHLSHSDVERNGGAQAFGSDRGTTAKFFVAMSLMIASTTSLASTSTMHCDTYFSGDEVL